MMGGGKNGRENIDEWESGFELFLSGEKIVSSTEKGKKR